MFIFLAPLALFGLGLLSIPIVLHLFKPRRVRTIPFSSLRWLKASQHRLSRRIKWHQVILFLLRAAFIALLVLALARPIFSSGRVGAGSAERLIVLDTSRSMNYTVTGRATPIARGRQVAEKLLLEGLAGDRTAVLLSGRGAELLGPLVTDPGLYLTRLRAVGAGLGESDLGAALQIIPPMLLPKRPGASANLFLITDNMAQSWSQGGIARFMAEAGVPVRVHVIDVGPDLPQNAWIADAQTIKHDEDRRKVRVQLGAVGDEVQERTVRLSRVSGLPELTQKVSVQPGRLATVEFDIPAALELAGKVAQVSIEPGDALPSDDVSWLPLDARGVLEVLVIEPDSTQIAELQPGYHLRTALEALSFAEPGYLHITRRSDAEVKPEEIAQADVIILAEVPSLSEERLVALLRRVETGAGLVVFLGPAIDLTFYNTRLHDPLRPSMSLLPAEIGELVDVRKSGGSLAHISGIQWTHPLLARLLDPTFGDLAQVGFNRYYRLTFDEQKADTQVIAAVGQGAPAIVESALGDGRVLLFNTTANDAWSDLPRRKSYVPLIDRMLNHLGGGLRRGTFEIGEAVMLPLPRAEAEALVSVTTPGGRKVTPSVRTVAGRTVMQIEAVDEMGVYLASYKTVDGDRTLPFVVQAGRKDSALARVDRATLEKWWEPAELTVTAPSDDAGKIVQSERRLLLDPWMMALACAALLAEMVLVHWYCPKAHPKVTSESVLARHGFFAPAESGGTKKL